MCIGSLFKSPKVETPTIPPPPPTPSPPPTPTPVDSQTQQADAATKRRKQLRSGLQSTIKTRGIFGQGAELSSVTSTGKNTLG